MPCRCSNCCHQAPDESHLLVELKFASTLPHFTLTFEERWDSVETQNLWRMWKAVAELLRFRPHWLSTRRLVEPATERYEIEKGLRALYQATAHPACTSTLAPSPRHTCAEGNKLPFIRWPSFTIEWIKFVKDSITLIYNSCQSKTSSCVATRIHQMSLKSNILAATKRGFNSTYVVGKFL